MEKPKRILYYDLLNIAACMAVIALHHNCLLYTSWEMYAESVTGQKVLAMVSAR